MLFFRYRDQKRRYFRSQRNVYYEIREAFIIKIQMKRSLGEGIILTIIIKVCFVVSAHVVDIRAPLLRSLLAQSITALIRKREGILAHPALPCYCRKLENG